MRNVLLALAVLTTLLASSGDAARIQQAVAKHQAPRLSSPTTTAQPATPSLEALWSFLPTNSSVGIGQVFADMNRGRAFVLQVDEMLTNGYVTCLDVATGATVWQQPLAAIGCDTQYLNSMSMYDSGSAIVAICDFAGAFDKDTGNVLWSVAWNPGSDSEVFPGTVFNGHLYSPFLMTYANPVFYLFSIRVSDGHVVWNVSLPFVPYAVIATSTGIVVQQNQFPGTTAGFDTATGATLWSAPSLTFFNQPTVCGDGALLISSIGVVALQAKTGAVTWNVTADTDAGPISAICDANEQVVFFTTTAYVQALDRKTGSEIWRFWGPSAHIFPPASAHSFYGLTQVSGGLVFAPYFYGDVAVISAQTGTSQGNISWPCADPMGQRFRDCAFTPNLAKNDGITLWTTVRMPEFDGTPFASVPAIFNSASLQQGPVALWSNAFVMPPSVVLAKGNVALYYTQEWIAAIKLVE